MVVFQQLMFAAVPGSSFTFNLYYSDVLLHTCIIVANGGMIASLFLPTTHAFLLLIFARVFYVMSS